MVTNGASSHKTYYIDILSKILNREGNLNRYIGSKVKAILLNGWMPTGGVASGRVCPAKISKNIKKSQKQLFSKNRNI